jgi:four helix bundle protein
MDIFHLTKSFPDQEKFGLNSQIRRSSRSVCSSIAEAYRKRKYPDILFLKPQMQKWRI